MEHRESPVVFVSAKLVSCTKIWSGQQQKDPKQRLFVILFFVILYETTEVLAIGAASPASREALTNPEPQISSNGRQHVTRGPAVVRRGLAYKAAAHWSSRTAKAPAAQEVGLSLSAGVHSNRPTGPCQATITRRPRRWISWAIAAPWLIVYTIAFVKGVTEQTFIVPLN